MLPIRKTSYVKQAVEHPAAEQAGHARHRRIKTEKGSHPTFSVFVFINPIEKLPDCRPIDQIRYLQ
jgi:hypothetical protein